MADLDKLGSITQIAQYSRKELAAADSSGGKAFWIGCKNPNHHLGNSSYLLSC
jgi:hypothetical protein